MSDGNVENQEQKANEVETKVEATGEDQKKLLCNEENKVRSK